MDFNNDFWKKITFAHRPLWVRIWIFSGVLAILYYIIVSNTYPAGRLTVRDMAILAYGMGSLALYLLIYEFKW
jgi:hypothetical protein